MCILLNVKKHEKTFALNVDIFRARKLSKKFLQTIDFYDKIYLRDILLNSLLTHIRAGQRPKGGKFA